MTDQNNSLGNSNRTVVGHPVDVASGSVYTAWTDIALRGFVPVRWRRFYSSASSRSTPMGIGWSTFWYMKLRRNAAGFVLTDDEGVDVNLAPVSPGLFRNAGAEMELFSRGQQMVVNHWHHAQKYIFDPYPQSPDRYRLAAVENTVGDRANAHYSPSDVLVAIEVPGHRRLLLTHDAGLHLSRIDLANREGDKALVARYRHDATGHLIEAADAGGGTMSYAYDERGRMVQETNQLGGRFYFEYDDLDRCTRTWGDDGYLTRHLEYLPERRCTRVTDSRGGTSSYFFDGSNSLLGKTDSFGFRHRTIRAPGSVQEIDPLGGVKMRVYDDEGHLVSQQEGPQVVVHSAYDANHKLVQEIDADGNEWRYEYTADGVPTKATDAGGHSWDITCNEHGAIAKIKDPCGGLTSYEYDDHGNEISRQDPRGAVTRRTYDLFGSLRYMRTTDGIVYEYDYDACHRLTQLKSGGRLVRAFQYDAAGNLVGTLCPGEQRSRNRFDRFSLRLARYHGSSDEPSCSWKYDQEGAVLRFEDGEARGVNNEYDVAGRLLRRVYDDGSTDSYTYDAIGRILTHSGDGIDTSYQYDSSSRLVEKRSLDGSVTRFAYNKRRQLVRAENWCSIVELTRDWAGRVLKEVQNGKTLQHEFDARGCRVRSTHADGTLVDYSYDAARRLAGVSVESAGAHEFSESGLSTRHLYPNGVSESFDLDFANLCIRQRVAEIGAQHAPVISRDYSLAPHGSITSIADAQLGLASMRYDAHGRLSAVESKSVMSEEFRYDRSGNLTGTKSGSRAFDRKNRLTDSGGTRYQYDQGRRTLEISGGGDRGSTLQFDGEGQLVAVRDAHGVVAEYRYDALGRRIAKVVNGVEDRFLYDGDQLALETRAATGEEHFYLYWPNSFRPMSKRIRKGGNSRTEAWYQYHLDLRGAPIGLTDKNGEVAWRAVYTAFGAATVMLGNPGLNPLRLPGQYFDAETRLCYNRFRYYNPDTACYLSPDPLGYIAGANLFSYTRDPFNKVDPLGLDCGDPDRVHLYHGTLDENALRETGFTTLDKYGGEGVPPYVCVSTDPAAAHDAVNPQGMRVDAQTAPAPAVLQGSMSQAEFNSLHSNGDLSTKDYNGFGHDLGGSSETKARTPAGVAALNRAFGLPGGN